MGEGQVDRLRCSRETGQLVCQEQVAGLVIGVVHRVGNGRQVGDSRGRNGMDSHEVVLVMDILPEHLGSRNPLAGFIPGIHDAVNDKSLGKNVGRSGPSPDGDLVAGLEGGGGTVIRHLGQVADAGRDGHIQRAVLRQDDFLITAREYQTRYGCHIK